MNPVHTALITKGPKYTDYQLVFEPQRDAFRIVASGPAGTWVVSVDALLVSALERATGRSVQLLQLAAHHAEAGEGNKELVASLGHLMRQHQHLQPQQGLGVPFGMNPGLQISQLQQQAAMQQQIAASNALQNGPAQGFGQQQGFGQMQAMQNAFAAPPIAEKPKPKLWEKPERVDQEILAYRSWMLDWEYVSMDGAGVHVMPVLHSLNQQTVWPGPTLTATVTPAENTKSGIYAVGVEERFAGNFSAHVVYGGIWGQVALSGLVVEGENGYRAEVCTIRRLFVGGNQRMNVYLELVDLARLLADRYQCDVSPVPLYPTIDYARELHHRERRD